MHQIPFMFLAFVSLGILWASLVTSLLFEARSGGKTRIAWSKGAATIALFTARRSDFLSRTAWLATLVARAATVAFVALVAASLFANA